MATLNQKIIIGAVVLALVDEGYRIELCDRDGGGLYLYAAPDAGSLPETGAEYWVRFSATEDVYGVIHDYSVNLEEVIAPVLVLVESLNG